MPAAFGHRGIGRTGPAGHSAAKFAWYSRFRKGMLEEAVNASGSRVGTAQAFMFAPCRARRLQLRKGTGDCRCGRGRIMNTAAWPLPEVDAHRGCAATQNHILLPRDSGD